MASTPRWIVLALIVVSFAPIASAQNAPPAAASPSGFTDDYPERTAGILIQGHDDWLSLAQVTPSKSRVKNGIAASFTYGAVRGVIEADYSGEHAAIQIVPGRPTICICHMLSLIGDPLLVKLHPQKNGTRMLDGGRLGILQAKMADANKNDVVPTEVSNPEERVWLIRPRDPLPPGEYALMLGSQNVAIFPFTVTGDAPQKR